MGGTRRYSSPHRTPPRQRRNSYLTADTTSSSFITTLLLWLAAASPLLLTFPRSSSNFDDRPNFATKSPDWLVDSTLDRIIGRSDDSKMYANLNNGYNNVDDNYDMYRPNGAPFRQNEPDGPKGPIGHRPMGHRPMGQRPMGLRWRDDSRMMQRFNDITVMPVLTEHRSSSPFGRSVSPASSRPTTSASRYDYQPVRRHEDSPSLEDIDLIDVLWRSDIAMEKGARHVAPAEQYECDLQMLTEKSTIAPLNAEDHARYEDLSKNFYTEFYTSYASNTNGKMKTSGMAPPMSRSTDIPTDEDLAELLEDVSKEGSQLNQLDAFLEPTQPLMHNVSMTQGLVYSQNNLTEMEMMADTREELTLTSLTSSSQHGTLFNNTDVDTQQTYIQPSELSPNDVFPAVDYTFVPMQNDTAQAVISNGNVTYEHTYHNSQQRPPQEQEPQQHQQPQMSPAFDSYFSNRQSFSDSADSSSSSCSRLSSESPRYNSETENHVPTSRFYGKLVPNERSTDTSLDRRTPSSRVVVPLVGQRKRGRQSKDEQLASENELPVSAQQIAEMSLSELQRVLKQDSLTEYQKQLIRKIRRRGKNKVAARTCRQRRTDRSDKFSYSILGCDTDY